MTKDESRKAKEWLWGFRDALRDCRRLEEEYRQLISSQESPKAIEYDGMPGRGRGGDGSDLSSLMALREDLITRIIKKKASIASLMSDRIEAIESLPSSAQREVMSMRYLQLAECRPMSWAEIAARSGYSEQHIYDIHGRALENLYRALKDQIETEFSENNES